MLRLKSMHASKWGPMHASKWGSYLIPTVSFSRNRFAYLSHFWLALATRYPRTTMATVDTQVYFSGTGGNRMLYICHATPKRAHNSWYVLRPTTFYIMLLLCCTRLYVCKMTRELHDMKPHSVLLALCFGDVVTSDRNWEFFLSCIARALWCHNFAGIIEAGLQESILLTWTKFKQNMNK